LILINKVVGFVIFSLSGIFISDLMRIFFIEEKDEIFRIAYIIFLIAYIGGLLFPLLYDMINVGFLVLIMESIRRISEERRKRKKFTSFLKRLLCRQLSEQLQWLFLCKVNYLKRMRFEQKMILFVWELPL